MRVRAFRRFQPIQPSYQLSWLLQTGLMYTKRTNLSLAKDEKSPRFKVRMQVPALLTPTSWIQRRRHC